MPHVECLPRRAVEGRGEPEHPVPELGRGHRIPAVQRFHPGQGGRSALLPADEAGAERHALAGHLIADRLLREHGGRRPPASQTSVLRVNQTHGTRNENGRRSRCTSRCAPSGESCRV